MAKVGTKGRVTLPRTIRDALRIGSGSSVAFDMDCNGSVVLRKAGADRPRPVRFDRVRGSAGPGMSTDEVMALMRGD